MNNLNSFNDRFKALTGTQPFPWQTRMFRRFTGELPGGIPTSCCLPTGLGKTSVIAIWMLALADGAALPRRLVYVVNRRTVVDQTTYEMLRYREAIANDERLSPLKPQFDPLPISTLRGQFAENGAWCEDPSRPAIVCGTVDMIGSRLLFGGYRIGFKARPLHAAFLAQDSLIIHDEAHLEPAFQNLIEQICAEQQREPSVAWPKLKIMELTATSKTNDPFELDSNHPDSEKNDYHHPFVNQRMNAAKSLHLHPLADEKKPQKEMAAKAFEFANSGDAIVVFASSVESVLEIANTISKNSLPVKTLTGTMRGKERDELAGETPENADRIFARFLPKPPLNAISGTVYLICTSAGEVGVNISGDHLICDLTTYESMAQRFGRVNRFGNHSHTEIHVFHPIQWQDSHPRLVDARKKTLALLQSLNGIASPKALSELPNSERSAAFTPLPEILRATDILFDAWSLTSIRGKLPGRPDVEPWLHGVVEDEPPQTKIAWRNEVQLLSDSQYSNRLRQDLMEAYPLIQHELLTEPSYRAFKHFQLLAKRNLETNAWVIDDFGRLEVVSLSSLVDKEKKQLIERRTILLDPSVGGLNEAGMLDGTSESASDVSETADRCRRWNNDEPQPGTHEVFSVVFRDDDDEDESETLRWFVRRNTGEPRSRKPVLLKDHVRDVEKRLAAILESLGIDDQISRCLLLAAKYHDHGKSRAMFQTMLGNQSGTGELWAKSGKRSASVIPESYRHEFGSLHDLPDASELGVSDEGRELVLHLIAAHHGRARPHFPTDEIFDPDATPEQDKEMAIAVIQRFGRLQKRFGRWGLAYLESLLRAADWSASANPSSELEDSQ